MAQCGVHYQLMGSIQRKSDSLLQCATECTCDAVVHLKRPNPENYKIHQNPKTRFLGDNQVFGEFYGFFPKTLFFSGYGCLTYIFMYIIWMFPEVRVPQSSSLFATSRSSKMDSSWCSPGRISNDP